MILYKMIYSINMYTTVSIIMHEYHYIRYHFVRRSDCTYIIYHGPIFWFFCRMSAISRLAVDLLSATVTLNNSSSSSWCWGESTLTSLTSAILCRQVGLGLISRTEATLFHCLFIHPNFQNQKVLLLSLLPPIFIKSLVRSVLPCSQLHRDVVCKYVYS